MPIERNTVVSFHYTLSDANGVELETSRDAHPTLYLHGHNNIIPGLEQAMAGKDAGDTFSVTLEPKEAYGERNEGLMERVPAKYLKHEGKLTPGKAVRINSNQGMKMGTVIKAGKFSVDVDMNHPLAGETLTFDVEIVKLREATQEEVSHGHAHGEGGHQHD